MKARLNCQVATIKALSPWPCLAQWGQTNLEVEVDLTRSKDENSIYFKRTIISRGLYNFCLIFYSDLYSKLANIADNLCTKQGYSSKISAVYYNQERIIMAQVWVYVFRN